MRFFFNGEAKGTGDLTGVTFYNSSADLIISASADPGDTAMLDEVRISKGIARWTSDFTPPTSSYSRELQVYSESSIKTEGDYAMKVIAVAGDSLLDSIERTYSPALDLSDLNLLTLKMRASRTGPNIRFDLHDSGGAVFSITPTIDPADSYQTIAMDLSSVPNVDKDAIDSVSMTILDASASNTIYLDEWIAPATAANRIELYTSDSKRVEVEDDGDVNIISGDLKLEGTNAHVQAREVWLKNTSVPSYRTPPSGYASMWVDWNGGSPRIVLFFPEDPSQKFYIAYDYSEPVP